MTARLNLHIESLDFEGQGVAHHHGKVIFVEGALPQEHVVAEVFRSKPKYEKAEVVQVLKSSVARVQPACEHFSVCGGCSMQHIDPTTQVAIKQRVLEDLLWHLAKVRPGYLLPVIQGGDWAYRYRARLAVRHLKNSAGVLVGFHERKSSYVADISTCLVLPSHVSQLLLPLRELIAKLSISERIPQIEIAVGEGVTALVFRHLQNFNALDISNLRHFEQQYTIQVWLQPGDSASVHLLTKDRTNVLKYRLPEFNLELPFNPTDFTQINHAVNRVMVERAIRILDPQPHERVADLFCGLGNFTLALASRAHSVIGIEGSDLLIERASQAAQLNGVDRKVNFIGMNLFEIDIQEIKKLGRLDKWLIDPPREGALSLVKALVKLTQTEQGSYQPPVRILYISCNPATLARDAAVLVQEGSYQLTAAGIVNMFPHTSHVESMAIFDLCI